MCQIGNLFKAILFFAILISCIIFWLLQSLPTIFEFFNKSDGILKKKSLSYEELALPKIVICNKLPYTQAGLSALSEVPNPDVILEYLREWLDPSISSSPDYVALSSAQDQMQAEATVAQLFPNAGLKQHLDSILLPCQDLISSCAYGGEVLSGFDCCRHVEQFLGTINGVCWIFTNHTFMQNIINIPHGLQITFQIARNSFISNAQSFHPGIEIFLASDEIRDRIRIATELQKPYYLKDKKFLRIFIEKHLYSDKSNENCQDSTTETTIENSFVSCLIEAAIRECACVPLTTVLWTLQGDLNSRFLKRFNVSSICSLRQYNGCARKYVDFSRPNMWEYDIPNRYKLLKTSVEECKKYSQIPCQSTSYNSEDYFEGDLPQEYKNTQDFVTRFSLAYNSLTVQSDEYNSKLRLLEFLTILGYNFATWFAIGHLIWSLLTWLLDKCWHNTSSMNQKVYPKEPLIISSPLRNSNQLPPLEPNPNFNATKIIQTRPSDI